MPTATLLLLLLLPCCLAVTASEAGQQKRLLLLDTNWQQVDSIPINIGCKYFSLSTPAAATNAAISSSTTHTLPAASAEDGTSSDIREGSESDQDPYLGLPATEAADSGVLQLDVGYIQQMLAEGAMQAGDLVHLKAEQDDSSEAQLMQVAKVLTEKGGSGQWSCAISWPSKEMDKHVHSIRNEQGLPAALLARPCTRLGGCCGSGRTAAGGGGGSWLHQTAEQDDSGEARHSLCRLSMFRLTKAGCAVCQLAGTSKPCMPSVQLSRVAVGSGSKPQGAGVLHQMSQTSSHIICWCIHTALRLKASTAALYCDANSRTPLYSLPERAGQQGVMFLSVQHVTPLCPAFCPAAAPPFAVPSALPAPPPFALPPDLPSPWPCNTTCPAI
jgi:hypothetical protein